MTDGPRAIGVILDGNRRFAKERGLPTVEGHRRGFEKVKELLSWAKEASIEHVVIYAFSTENWNRAAEEVDGLMNLFDMAMGELLKESQKMGRIRFIGERTHVPESLARKMEEVEKATEARTEGTLWIALSYGGRAEILAGVNKLLESGAHSVDEMTFAGALWSAELPDPDLIIRTGGDRRLSNFLTWQSVYSELFFVSTYWPDFSKEEFDGILSEFAERERRRGK